MPGRRKRKGTLTVHAILTYLLITVEVICSIMLLGVILIQRTKSQGMGLAFGGAVGESIFGAQMGNVLTRTTVVLSVIFLVTTTLLAMLGARSSGASSVVDGSPAPLAAPAVPGDMGGATGSGAPVDAGPVDMGGEAAPELPAE